jgi:hypothetical protein
VVGDVGEVTAVTTLVGSSLAVVGAVRASCVGGRARRWRGLRLKHGVGFNQTVQWASLGAMEDVGVSD